ncbi:MAG: hypothetical protein HKP01_13590 [Gemmatimonadetes bacterium]|nr:hypothetical protein [Gemmatimonadota bacterium]
MFDFALLIPLTAIFFLFGVPIMAVATRLEQAIRNQGQQVDRLIEAEVFRRQLEAGRPKAR